jgi:hypothetical protein
MFIDLAFSIILISVLLYVVAGENVFDDLRIVITALLIPAIISIIPRIFLP